MENLSRVFQKEKRKKTNKNKQKKNMKRLSFITQFKIDFLLPFSGCRKVLGKMPVVSTHCENYIHDILILVLKSERTNGILMG